MSTSTTMTTLPTPGTPKAGPGERCADWKHNFNNPQDHPGQSSTNGGRHSQMGSFHYGGQSMFSDYGSQYVFADHEGRHLSNENGGRLMASEYEGQTLSAEHGERHLKPPVSRNGDLASYSRQSPAAVHTYKQGLWRPKKLDFLWRGGGPIR